MTKPIPHSERVEKHQQVVFQPLSQPWNPEQESESQNPLRPTRFEDYPGQREVCEHLKIYTQSAKMRKKTLDHCLFYGPPGVGKTTMAGIIAHTMGYEFKSTSGPIIERPSDIMGVLAQIEANTVLFIDEIHRLPQNVEEILYAAMEDNSLDVLVGQGTQSRAMKLSLPPFTLIGATTKAGLLTSPLRDRFGIIEHFNYYDTKELIQIINRNVHFFNCAIEDLAAQSLAMRCRGTPRVANTLLRRMVDFATVAQVNTLTPTLVDDALLRMGIDCHGLSQRDRLLLHIMESRYGGGPVGIEALAATLNEEKSTLEDIYEPYLVHAGFIIRSSRGRILTEKAKNHLFSLETTGFRTRDIL